MSNEELFNTSNWYVIHTHPRQEDRANRNLKAWNLETLAPRTRELCYNQITGEPSYCIKPLFPRYIFARFKLNDLYHKVRFTRGINGLVKFNDYPTPVDDEIIGALQSRTGRDGIIAIGERLKPGDKVFVKEGPLKSFFGILEQEMKDHERVKILLQTLNYQAHVVVSADMVRKVEQSYAMD